MGHNVLPQGVRDLIREGVAGLAATEVDAAQTLQLTCQVDRHSHFAFRSAAFSSSIMTGVPKKWGSLATPQSGR